jgi:hypothetical protein
MGRSGEVDGQDIVKRYGKAIGITVDVHGHSLWATAATNALSHEAVSPRCSIEVSTVGRYHHDLYSCSEENK